MTNTDVLYHLWNGAVATDLTTTATVTATVPTLPPPTAIYNLDPLIDSQWHTSKNSPCINAGTLTEAPPFDFEGDKRPLGRAIDIGPDEVE